MTVFPFMPNWRDSYKLTYEFKTDVIVSRSGKEQRRALRQTPRKTVEYTATLFPSALVAFEQLLNGASQSLTIPEDPRGARATTALNAGGTSVGVASVPSWLVNGASVILVYGQTAIPYTVSTVIGTTVTLSTSVTENWPVGTRICQPLTGRVTGSMSGKALTNGVAEYDFLFNVDPGTELPDEGTPVPPLNGYEVFPFKPDWSVNVDLSVQQPTDTIDYGMGRIGTYTPVAFTTYVRQPTFVGRSVAEVDSIRQFFARMKGQWGEFYYSSGQPDIVLSVATLSGHNVLTVAGMALYNAYAADTVHKALMVEMPDGTRYPRAVTSITTDSGNSLITVDTNAPVDWPVGTLISWMPRSRFATDQCTIEYLTDSVAQTKLSIQSLENLT